MTDLRAFMDMAQELADKAEQGRRIKEAAEKGHVKTEPYERELAPGFDGELRKMVAQIVIGVWNTQHRPMKLNEIYQKLREKVAERIEDHDWPAIWGFPIKRTVDRRVNEAADYRFYTEKDEVPPIIALKAGTYQANPALFEKEVKEAIRQA